MCHHRRHRVYTGYEKKFGKHRLSENKQRQPDVFSTNHINVLRIIYEIIRFFLFKSWMNI